MGVEIEIQREMVRFDAGADAEVSSGFHAAFHREELEGLADLRAVLRLGLLDGRV